MANFNQKKITTKSGKEYTLQHPGVRATNKIVDRVKNKFGVPSDEKIGDEMLEHVVVAPKMRMEDFSTYKEYAEVVSKAFAFLQGEEEDEGEEDGEAAKG